VWDIGMDKLIEQLSRVIAGRASESGGRRSFLVRAGRLLVGGGAALAVSPAQAAPHFFLPGCSGFEYDPFYDPISEIGFYDGFVGYDWIDMGDFGWPMFDPLDLQSSAQQRVNRCVTRCVGGATGIEGQLIRLDCEYRCTQAEIERIQRQQQRRIRRRRIPRRRPTRNEMYCL
jgi:hypothetical protein